MVKTEKWTEIASKMTIFASPKKGSYIVKKDSAEKIVNSKTPKEIVASIQKNAELFRAHNLKTSQVDGV